MSSVSRHNSSRLRLLGAAISTDNFLLHSSPEKEATVVLPMTQHLILMDLRWAWVLQAVEMCFQQMILPFYLLILDWVGPHNSNSIQHLGEVSIKEQEVDSCLTHPTLSPLGHKIISTTVSVEVLSMVVSRRKVRLKDFLRPNNIPCIIPMDPCMHNIITGTSSPCISNTPLTTSLHLHEDHLLDTDNSRHICINNTAEGLAAGTDGDDTDPWLCPGCTGSHWCTGDNNLVVTVTYCSRE